MLKQQLLQYYSKYSYHPLVRCKLHGVVSENPPHEGSLEISRGRGSQRPSFVEEGQKQNWYSRLVGLK